MPFIKAKVPNKSTFKYVLVDDDSCETLSGFRWYLGKTGYAFRSKHLGYINGKKRATTVMMHRIIANARGGKTLVDHINGNKLDNRKSNLRICTHLENNRNQRCLSKNNKSGYKGVSWNKRRGKWCAQIRFNGKVKFIGYFGDILMARDAYVKKSLELFKDFSPFR